VIYLDNADTSFPKPPEVVDAMADFLVHRGGNPGGSGHALAVAAQGAVAETRRLLASLFHAHDPSRIVFALNATDALSMALWGLLRPGDRVVTTCLEHDAVARPLAALAERGVAVARVPCAPDGSLDPDDLSRELQTAPTRLVAMIHASNVCGTILPVREAARVAHRHGALLLLDAAQTAGVLPIDVAELEIDLLAFPGHKGLLGPTGTGGLYVAPDVRLSPVRRGTGNRSGEERQPKDMPEALESGTVNTVGIAGLGAAVRVLKGWGLANVQAHEARLAARLLAGLEDVPGVRVYGPADPRRRVAVVSLTMEGWDPVDLAAALDSSFAVAVRPGLHCAPLAHRTLRTYPRGTVRLSPGCFTTEGEVDQALAALRELAEAIV
jgi:cysteine desulfurase / selenocysteine lyase